MEDDFFLKKMKGVKPIKKDKNQIKSDKLNQKKTNNKTKSKEEINFQEKPPTFKKKNTEYSLTFSDINKELKKGNVKIDRRIDLHGYTLIDAYDKFKNEVLKNYNNHKRCLLVITGKGVHKKFDNINDEKPKLYYGKIKNSIKNWINEQDLKKYILTYQDAGIEHGGDGSIFVYLRKKKT
tara:strand:+ start:955 stop:1494 length:540 start_codon:yes stop_codon:yes gene_type:complete